MPEEAVHKFDLEDLKRRSLGAPMPKEVEDAEFDAVSKPPPVSFVGKRVTL